LLIAANGAEPQKKSSRQTSEERLWKIAVDSDRAGAYDAYLRKYPDGHYAALARARLASMEAAAAPAAPSSAPPAPQAQRETEQQPALTGISRSGGLSAEDELWRAATITGASGDYQAYLREYPQGRYAAIARLQLTASSRAVAESGAGSGQAPVGSQAATAPSRGEEQESVAAAVPAAPSGPARTIRLGDQAMTGNFVSDPQTGKVSGTGHIDWNNGNNFQGTLVHGVKQGKGQFIWRSGQRYSGDWANDLPNGKGTIVFANGDRYDGDVKDGQAHGQGIARFKGGDSYAGNWVNGKRHGTGRYSWVQGGYWEGEFRNGERTENGTMTRAEAATVPSSATASGASRAQ
jgi:hypothetical protein